MESTINTVILILSIHGNHKFAKVYSAKCILSSNSPKFATAKVSLYTVANYYQPSIVAYTMVQPVYRAVSVYYYAWGSKYRLIVTWSPIVTMLILIWLIYSPHATVVIVTCNHEYSHLLNCINMIDSRDLSLICQ